MKIALLLTGFVRTYNYRFPALKRELLDKYDVDVYLSTWSKTESSLGSHLVDFDIEEFVDQYRPWLKNYIVIPSDMMMPKIDFIDRENDVFKIDSRAISHAPIWIDRLMRQWYLVMIGANQINNFYDYDKIVRTRFDVELIKFDILDQPFIIPKDIGGWDFSDHLAYGNPIEMDKYLNMYSNIERLYRDYNIDITHAVNMLKFYIQDYCNILTTTDEKLKYDIRKL